MNRQIVCAAFRLWCFCLAVIGLNNGCVNLSTQGRQKSSDWGGYSYGQKLHLLQDCFIARVNDGLEGCRYALLPPGHVWTPGRIFPAPNQVASWSKGVTNEWRSLGVDIIGVIPAGTMIEAHHVNVNRGWSWWAGAHRVSTVYGQIIGGKFQGQHVDMTDMSVYGESERAPNPALLKPVGNAMGSGSADKAAIPQLRRN